MQIGPKLTPSRKSHLPTKSVPNPGSGDSEPRDIVCLVQRRSETKSQEALNHSYQQILKFSSGKVAGELSGVPAQTLMYHGTPVDFDAVGSRPSMRIDGDKIDWQGTAIFAATDPRIALHYTAKRGTGIGTGIDLRSVTRPEEPIRYYLSGGSNLEDAMNKAYGNPERPESCMGYIHLLDKSRFVREPGLGAMEMISRDEKANLGALIVNRRAAIDALVREGSVELAWDPDN